MGALCVLLGLAIWLVVRPKTQNLEPARLAYKPRQPIETSGFIAGFHFIKPWGTEATLDECAAAYKRSFPGGMKYLERAFQQGLEIEKIMLTRANLLHAQGNPAAAYQVLEELRTQVHGTDLEAEWLYTVVYYLGISGLRLAENENCIECRGESSCIFPLAPAALHMNPKGSRLAIKHFKEYLAQFPDDVEVKWLLNLAHMTLGEHPAKVEPRHLLTFDSFNNSEFDIGRIRDIGHLVGVNRFNQSGGGIMEDFDNDGLFDIVVTCWAPSDPMAFFRNKGDGTFEDRTKAAGLEGQRGGLYCVQGDFNNDGNMDIFIPRGSWLPADLHQRPSLLRNNGDGTFTDVTKEAGMMAPMNSVSASWADYDNDGLLDLFVCCQQQPCMLYRNKGQGVFEEVAAQAGLPRDLLGILGAAWIDFDNDGYPDLFVNQGRGFMPGKDGAARLYRNDRKGRFIDMTKEMGIDGPANGFSCWAFDYDNDGWLDIFATSIVNQSLDVIVKGMMGQ
jgi:hypothetical protein